MLPEQHSKAFQKQFLQKKVQVGILEKLAMQESKVDIFGSIINTLY